jgi:hypothetical protein
MLAPGLAACGGSSGGSSSQGSSPAAPSGGTNTSPAPIGADGLTPPGTRLSFGQAATLDWTTLDAPKPIKVQVTVKSIEKGSIADFKKSTDLDAADRHSTPYHVMVQVKALTARTWKGSDDPAFEVRALLDSGHYQLSHFFFDQEGSCSEPTSAPRPFVTGKSYTTCLNFMIPGGHSVKALEWLDGPTPKSQAVPLYLSKPVLWSGS